MNYLTYLKRNKMNHNNRWIVKYDKDNNEFSGEYMIKKCNKNGTKCKAWGTPKPFVRVVVKNINEI